METRPADHPAALRGRWEEWLPLRGRWLRGALGGLCLAAAACLPVLPAAYWTRGALALAILMLALLVRTPPPTSESGVSLAAALCCPLALLIGWGLFSFAVPRPAGSGFDSFSLYSHVPLSLMLTTFCARAASPYRRAGALCRIAAASVIGFWLLILCAPTWF